MVPPSGLEPERSLQAVDFESQFCYPISFLSYSSYSFL